MTEFSPWPSFTEAEAEAVREVLLSNSVNQWTGDAVSRFEEAFAVHVGVERAVAVSNGTAALDAALAALDIGSGDEVIVTPRSFVASASAIVMRGAVPIFADVDLSSQLITPATVAPLISDRTRGILCVHLAGWPCDMDGFRTLVAGKGISLIEDCAQAHGAKYKGIPVGGIGDIAAWSFCQDKIMTTGGEGGMVTTNDETLFRKTWSYKDHGKSYAAVFEESHADGFRWLHHGFGTNARMTSIQAVIGLLQLTYLDRWHEQRSKNALAILKAAESCSALRVPPVPRDIEHAWYKCYVFVKEEKLKKAWDRDRIVREINARGVPCFSGSCSEIYLEKAFVDAKLGPPEPLVNARKLGQTSLMFLVHPTLSAAEVEKTTSVMCEVMEMAAVN